MKNTLSSKFFQIYGTVPEVIANAPGRINLIGEHTDYNLGYVLPAAIDKNVWFLASRRQDGKIRLWAEDFGEFCRFSLDRIKFSQSMKWANYVKGIFWVLIKQGFSISGLNGYISGDVPLEGGLSSSAALGMSVIFGLNALFGLEVSSLGMVEMGQRAENDFVGVQCGIMDQFVSAFGKKDHAVFLDCQTFEYEAIPFDLKNRSLGVLVFNSNVRRKLASSGYNQRRSESSMALEMLKRFGVQNFRDASIELIDEERKNMGETLYKRAKHVISENERVLSAVETLKVGDFNLLGKLLFQSHESLRDNYEVSCKELDLLYDAAVGFDGCLGARMIGAGFGGSGIAILKSKKMEAFKQNVSERAFKKGFKQPDFYDVEIGGGASAFKK